jgi:hypothetical protein
MCLLCTGFFFVFGFDSLACGAPHDDHDTMLHDTTRHDTTDTRMIPFD